MSTETQTVDPEGPDQPEVLVSERPGVLVITINRPQAKNAVTLAVAEGVAAALDTLDTRADLKPTLRDLDKVIALLRRNDRELTATITTLAPAARYFANAGGTGRWLDQNTPGSTPDNVGCREEGRC